MAEQQDSRDIRIKQLEAQVASLTAELQEQPAEYVRLLSEWGLSRYISIMKSKGKTDPLEWPKLDEGYLRNELNFEYNDVITFHTHVITHTRQSVTSAPESSSSTPSFDVGFMTAKAVLLGDTNVGKSSVALRFTKDIFDQYIDPTVGAAFMRKSVSVQSTNIKGPAITNGNNNLVQVMFEIWDTAGQERFRSLAPLYYRGAAAAVVVYDITNRESFDNAGTWIDEVVKQQGGHVVIALVGNKVDLEEKRVVSTAEGEQLAGKGRHIFLEASAKTSSNILEIFKRVARNLPKDQSAFDRKKTTSLDTWEMGPDDSAWDKCKCKLL